MAIKFKVNIKCNLNGETNFANSNNKYGLNYILPTLRKYFNKS